MTEKVGKTVCEGTVADLRKDKTGKQTVITLTRKNAYRVKKIRGQGTDDEAVLFHFRKRCTGMGSYVHTIEAADGETELHPSEFEKWEAVEFLYPGYLEDLLDAAYNAYRWSSFEPEARAETDNPLKSVRGYSTLDPSGFFSVNQTLSFLSKSSSPNSPS